MSSWWLQAVCHGYSLQCHMAVSTEPEHKVKVPRPLSPTTLGPGELFFRADTGTR